MVSITRISDIWWLCISGEDVLGAGMVSLSFLLFELSPLNEL